MISIDCPEMDGTLQFTFKEALIFLLLKRFPLTRRALEDELASLGLEFDDEFKQAVKKLKSTKCAKFSLKYSLSRHGSLVASVVKAYVLSKTETHHPISPIESVAAFIRLERLGEVGSEWSIFGGLGEDEIKGFHEERLEAGISASISYEEWISLSTGMGLSFWYMGKSFYLAVPLERIRDLGNSYNRMADETGYLIDIEEIFGKEE